MSLKLKQTLLYTNMFCSPSFPIDITDEPCNVGILVCMTTPGFLRLKNTLYHWWALQCVRDPPWNSELLRALGIEPLIIRPMCAIECIQLFPTDHTPLSNIQPQCSAANHCIVLHWDKKLNGRRRDYFAIDWRLFYSDWWTTTVTRDVGGRGIRVPEILIICWTFLHCVFSHGTFVHCTMRRLFTRIPLYPKMPCVVYRGIAMYHIKNFCIRYSSTFSSKLKSLRLTGC